MNVGDLHVRIRADLGDLKKGLQEAQNATATFADNMKRVVEIGPQLEATGRKLTKYLTIPLAAAGTMAAKSAIDFETAFAGVRKTVDATEEEYAKLREGFIELGKTIPIAVTELMAIGEAAGQLGIRTENILEFTDTMAKLGVATNMTSDQAATALARLANIMQMPQDQFDRLGATIVDLGNNLATTEAEIVEMGLRLAGAGNQIGMTEAQVLSFAGALSSVGVRAEAGGTAFSRVMLEMNNQVMSAGANLQLLAQVAGMTAQEFAQIWEDDPAAALTAFIDGLGQMQQAGENLVPVLNELGFGEIRVRDALLRTAGAGDLVRESLELGTEAWQENNALVNEAEERFKTTASQLQLLSNHLKIAASAIGEQLLPIINKFVQERLVPLLERLSNLSDTTKKIIIVIAGVTFVLGPLLAALGLTLGLIPKLITGFTTLGTVLRFLAANPIGMVITAIGLLIIGGYNLVKNWDEVKHRGLQAWGSLKVFVLEQVREMIAAFERLVGWIPKIGDALGQTVENLDQQILDEKNTMSVRSFALEMRKTADAAKELGDSAEGSASDLIALGDELSNALPPTMDLGDELAALGDQAGSAGGAVAQAAQDTRAAWERAADSLSNRLQILRTEYEIAAMAAEEKGGKAEELRLKLQSLNRQLDVQRDLVAAVKRGYDEVVAAKGADAEESQKLQLRLVQEQRAQAELEKQVRETTQAIRDNANELSDLAAEAERVAQKYRDDLAAAHEEYQHKVADVNRKLAEDERRVTEQYESELQRRTRALMDWVGLFDQVSGRDVSGDQLLENLRGQVAAFEDWEANIAELASRGVDQGLIEELRQMGPKAGPEIAALLTLTDKQLVDYVALWKQKNEQARREAVDQLQRQKADMQQKLIEIRQAAQQQLEMYRAEWERKNAEIRKNAEEEMKRIEERFQSIAEAGTKYGVDLMDNFTAGIQSRADRLRSVLEEMAAMVDSYMPHSPAKVGPLRRLNEWGPALVKGLADGIRRGLQMPDFSRAMAGMAALAGRSGAAAIANSYSTSSTSYGPIVIHVHGANGDDVLRALKRDLHRAGVRWPGGS